MDLVHISYPQGMDTSNLYICNWLIVVVRVRDYYTVREFRLIHLYVIGRSVACCVSFDTPYPRAPTTTINCSHWAKGVSRRTAVLSPHISLLNAYKTSTSQQESIRLKHHNYVYCSIPAFVFNFLVVTNSVEEVWIPFHSHWSQAKSSTHGPLQHAPDQRESLT